MRRILAFIASIALLVSAPALTAQNLLVNGGFETGDLTGWTTSAVGNPACQNLFEVTTFAALGGNYGLSGGVPRPGCESNSNTFFTQWIATIPGVSYVVSGTWAKRAGPPRELCPGYCSTYVEVAFGPSLGIGSGIPGFAFSLNDDSGYGVGATWQFSRIMVATSTLTMFELETWSQRDLQYIDNLSVVATPEPSTLAFLLSALVALGVILRRRTRGEATKG